MPFIDRSTLTYPATNAFPIRKWLDPANDPTSSDFRSFQVFDIWINDASNTAWIMVDRTATSGTWVQMGASGTGILTITGDAGGAVSADGANNIFLVGAADITITGNPGTNTLSVALDGTIANTYTTDAGNAIPSLGVLNILGAGGTTTSGAGNTVTVTSGPTVTTSFVTDAGTATPVMNTINVLGGTGCATTGVGDTVTINLDATVALTYTCDAGSATPAANNLNVIGGGATTTSGAGSTITINSTGGGISCQEVTVVGPTAMVVDRCYIANISSPSVVQLDLPLTSAQGSVIEIIGKGTGGFQVNQNAGQSIREVNTVTTVGVLGLVNSSEARSSLIMKCITADTDWQIVTSTGNLIFT